jgi:hypothetical protein
MAADPNLGAVVQLHGRADYRPDTTALAETSSRQPARHAA